MRKVKLCLSRARSWGAYQTEDTFQTLRGGFISSRLRLWAIISISPLEPDTEQRNYVEGCCMLHYVERIECIWTFHEAWKQQGGAVATG